MIILLSYLVYEYKCVDVQIYLNRVLARGLLTEEEKEMLNID